MLVLALELALALALVLALELALELALVPVAELSPTATPPLPPAPQHVHGPNQVVHLAYVCVPPAPHVAASPTMPQRSELPVRGCTGEENLQSEERMYEV